MVILVYTAKRQHTSGWKLLTVHMEQFSSSAVTCLKLRRYSAHTHSFKLVNTFQDGMPINYTECTTGMIHKEEREKQIKRR